MPPQRRPPLGFFGFYLCLAGSVLRRRRLSEDQSEELPLFQRASKGTKAQRMAREALGRNLLVLTSETWVTEA